jgi:hypothetical protein
VRLLVLVLLVACGATHKPVPPRLGAIAGLARDRTSGEAISMADITVADRTTQSNRYGIYDIDNLPPGTYTLVARFADQPVTIKNIEVSAGTATYVDVAFTLGDSTPIVIDFGNPRAADELERFATKVPRIEGVVADASSRARVAGAVVTATSDRDTLQTITDDHGRYRFDRVQPGTYIVSAYYSIGGRAQIEVRRSDIVVGAGEGVLVPLSIEIAGQ